MSCSIILDFQCMDIKLPTSQVWSFLKRIPALDPTPPLEFLSHFEPPSDLALKSLIKSHSTGENTCRKFYRRQYWYVIESVVRKTLLSTSHPSLLSPHHSGTPVLSKKKG